QVATQAQERKDIAVAVSHMDPAHPLRWRTQRLDTAFPHEALLALDTDAAACSPWGEPPCAKRVPDARCRAPDGSGVRPPARFAAKSPGESHCQWVPIPGSWGAAGSPRAARILDQQHLPLLTSILPRRLHMRSDQVFVADVPRVQKTIGGFQSGLIMQLL